MRLRLCDGSLLASVDVPELFILAFASCGSRSTVFYIYVIGSDFMAPRIILSPGFFNLVQFILVLEG